MEPRIWNSALKRHLTNAAQLAILLCCPQLPFPNLGSMILMHCYNDGLGESRSIMKKILESKIIANLRNNVLEESVEVVQYVDCSNINDGYLDTTIRNAMEIGKGYLIFIFLGCVPPDQSLFLILCLFSFDIISHFLCIPLCCLYSNPLRLTSGAPYYNSSISSLLHNTPNCNMCQ